MKENLLSAFFTGVIVSLLVSLLWLALPASKPAPQTVPEAKPSVIAVERMTDGYPACYIARDHRTSNEYLIVDIGGHPAVCPMGRAP